MQALLQSQTSFPFTLIVPLAYPNSRSLSVPVVAALLNDLDLTLHLEGSNPTTLEQVLPFPALSLAALWLHDLNLAAYSILAALRRWKDGCS